MTKINAFAILSISFLFTSFTASALESPIAPPNVEVVDEHRVNLATGQLAQKLQTVSIGGERGLSHSIQLYGDLWTEGSFYGFIDHYAGSSTYQRISGKVAEILMSPDGNEIRGFNIIQDQEEYDYLKRIHVMRVYGPTGSQDFMVYKNGIIRNASSVASGYTYRPVGDQRHSLIESADKRYLTWTASDGTETIFERTSPGTWVASSGARLREVRYPNGFKIRIGERAVTTNTGYMLKYRFNTGWRTPFEVAAINLAEEYCSITATSCSVSSYWPKATFIWPSSSPSNFKQGGLPPSSYLFKVIDGNGDTTEVQYEPRNICITDSGIENHNCAGNPPDGTKWQSRLVGIKNPGSSVFNYEYDYKNVGVGGGTGDRAFWQISTRAGEIANATFNGWGRGYGINQNASQNPYNNESFNSDFGIIVQSTTTRPGTLKTVIVKKQGRYEYQEDLRRNVEYFYPVVGGGPKTRFYYDGPRGNISKIEAIVAGGSNIVMSEAGYPSSCPVDKINSCVDKTKTCNSPSWTKDARGNITNYEYDTCARYAEPTKVTEPADNNNVRKTTFYKYEALHAYYKMNGESVVQDPDPIWLLTQEHTCRTSAATESGCAAGNLDMVKTEYYYGPQNGAANNLHLRGKAITAEGNGDAFETRVWCYEYDKFGNMIGETLPKGNSGNLQNCP